jgi:hypothetical protein
VLDNGLRLSIEVQSQDLSGAWVTVQGCELARARAFPYDQTWINAPPRSNPD